MLKEIQPVDLFETARALYPPDKTRKNTSVDSFAAWRSLAGSIYGAMRRGRSALDIWSEISFELDNIHQGGSKKEMKETQVLAPHIAKLVVGVNNLLVVDGEKITLEQLYPDTT